MTSAHSATDGVTLDGVTLDRVEWDDPDAARLRAAQQTELRERYGEDDIGHDMTGESILAMVLVRADGEPVACGALRDASADLGAGVGELKRMYVVPAQRGRGLSRVVLAELERRARALGLRRLVLETGVLQPDAMGLYLTSGYATIDNVGEYVGVVESRCFAKDLVADVRGRARDEGGASGAGPGHDAVAPEPPALVRPRPAVTLRAVDWDHPDATRLRREMFDDASLPRYPELAEIMARHGGYDADDAAQGVGALTTLVADVDGEPVGCVTLRSAPEGLPADTGELKKVFVRESARGLGIARLLLAAVEDEARARGLHRLVLHTGIRQPEAIALYVSIGYRPVPLFPRHVGDLLALCFGKDLA